LHDDILLGAEESGGIGVRDHIPERDGILNSMLLLEAVVASGKTPSEMVREMHREFGEFYFGRIDLKCPVVVGQALAHEVAAKPPANLAGYTVEHVLTVDGTKLVFADESWLLFRPSGTEPMLRIYCEATSKAKVSELLRAGEAMAAKAT
jgi:phosphomannomutase